ncbi:hypothetical protein [Pseudonocardia nigra]|uniref:hypothetical protein n=1 Tax=Pseudonocardia nigra TaxID=1921578 RepID=UPI001C5EA11B|nr:hypothetical protein [Pseudonocardia nigra]
MPTWLAAVVAGAAITAVYLFCMRPMRRGNCAMTGGSRQDPELARQIADLREELRVLRAEDALESGQVRTDRPGPGKDV